MIKSRISVAALVLAIAASASFGFAQGSGADTYKAKCQMCHGADGLAATPTGKMLKVEPLNSPELIKKSDADLIAVTKAGKGKMPGYASKLSDAEIKEVITFVRTLQKK